jgi:chemotaxis signal transduction protein
MTIDQHPAVSSTTGASHSWQSDAVPNHSPQTIPSNRVLALDYQQPSGGSFSYTIDVAAVKLVMRHVEVAPKTAASQAKFPKSTGLFIVNRAAGVNREARQVAIPVFRLQELLSPELSVDDQHRKSETLILLQTSRGTLALEGGIPSQELLIPSNRFLSVPLGLAHPLFQSVHMVSQDSLLPHFDPEPLMSQQATVGSMITKQAIEGLATFARESAAAGILLGTPVLRDQKPCTFGISFRQVLEIVARPTVVPLPGAAAGVIGLTVWKDLPIPVIDVNPFSMISSYGHSGLERVAMVLLPQRSGVIAIPLGDRCQGLVLPLDDGTKVLTKQIAGSEHFPIRGIYGIGDTTVTMPDIAMVVERLGLQ